MKKVLKITLCSDLCAAEGKHYAAMIDLDTALDKYGLPFIPSRRLKGCLRETAEYFFEKEELDAVFGVVGNDTPGSLRISDAHLKHYEENIHEIENKGLNTAEITDLFCSVRSETAIDGETVKDGSLRFVRVVNMHSPVTGKPIEFFAEIEFDDEYEQLINKAVVCLRNIGYHRNRGLGAVKCELTDSDKKVKHGDKISIAPDRQYAMRLTVKLTGDIMLPDSDGAHSGDYISGSSVLGAFAAAYIKKYPDGDFNSVFLTEDVRFGNMYIATPGKEKINCYVPAPRFLAKIKAAADETDKGIKNLLANVNPQKTYKPLKKGYINYSLGYMLPERKIVYHNSSVKTDDRLLYMQYCLCKDQYFSGEITAPGNKMKIIKELCDSGSIRFGRSKSAQYGSCEIVEASLRETDIPVIKLKKGTVAAYILESNAAITDEDGIFTVEYTALSRELDIDSVGVIADGPASVSVTSKTISGYNSKWNQKKPQHPVISAGSSIVFSVREDTNRPEYVYIGEKQNEGFGKVRLIPDADKIEIHCVKDEPEFTESGCMLADIVTERKTKDAILSLAVENSEKCKLNASQVGRIALMARDAQGFKDFQKRIESIKTDSIRNAAKSCFNEEELKAALNKCNIEINEDNREYIKYYIITLLTVRKYRLRKKGEKE